jgi:S-adenosylmethionine:tRNA ribosyltransferase-isomerase
MEVPDYELPERAIAQEPAEPRDSARLLDALSDPPRHLHVRDLPALLRPGDVLVVNTSRVVPARLKLWKQTGGAAEVLLVEPLPARPGAWEAMVRPSRRLPPGTVLWSAPPAPTGRPVTAPAGPAVHLVGTPEEPPTRAPASSPAHLVGTPEEPPTRAPASSPAHLVGTPAGPGTAPHGVPVVEVGERFPNGNREVTSLVTDLGAYGELALPPYIQRRLADPERYQTVYSERPGSVAAPTAGLHLTEAVLEACRQRGAQVAQVDLAVGPGTFRPIKAGRVEEHEMHAERYLVPEATWQACLDAKGSGGRVVAVGTTSVRALESAGATGLLSGRTELYIRPGHPFAVVDVLMSNFHQPRSTLLVLLEAFAGPRWRRLYELALEEGYRFLSFGDAMVVGRDAMVVGRA